MPDNEQAAKEQIVELFRLAGGMKTIDNLALALSGAPSEKIEHDIAAFSRGLEVSFARRQDWPSSEFVDFFIAASGALIRSRLAEISNTGSGSA
jgi:hypothetical protein